eukprot:m.28438 g.28438  ORF g.28438 m.28438 type:complete len:72 (+) comp30782_c0_seq1:131-346(+)
MAHFPRQNRPFFLDAMRMRLSGLEKVVMTIFLIRFHLHSFCFLLTRAASFEDKRIFTKFTLQSLPLSACVA